MLAVVGLVVHGDENAQRAVRAALGHVHGCVLSMRGVLAALSLLVVQAAPVGERHVARGQGARRHRLPPLAIGSHMGSISPVPP